MKMNVFEADFEVEKGQMMDFMTNHATFTNAEVLACVGGPTTRRDLFLRNLRKQGKMRMVGRQGNWPVYSLLSSHEAQTRAATKRATPRGAMWRAIRSLGRFTTEEIVAALAGSDAPVIEADARKFCSVLLDAGYLKVVQKARSHTDRPAIYLLVNNTGPLPPEIKRRQIVIDANQDRVVHVGGGVRL